MLIQIVLIFYFSIAYGVIAGVLSYLLINGIPYILRKISKDRIVPPDYHLAEEWVVPPGGIVPHWMWLLLLLFWGHFTLYFFAHSKFFFWVYRLRLLGRTPPHLEYQTEEEHTEKVVDNEELGEKEEPGSVVESSARSSKGVLLQTQKWYELKQNDNIASWFYSLTSFFICML